jgi:hypothetical protein
MLLFFNYFGKSQINNVNAYHINTIQIGLDIYSASSLKQRSTGRHALQSGSYPDLKKNVAFLQLFWQKSNKQRKCLSYKHKSILNMTCKLRVLTY